MSRLPILYTFTVSHFSEKARWGLDRSGASYREVVLLPGLHRRRLQRLGARGQVPVLEDGARICDGSGAILDHLDARADLTPLLPSEAALRAEVLEWERYLDAEVGETVRLVLYFHALQRPQQLIPAWSRGGPFWAPLLYRLALPSAARRLKRALGIDAAAARRDQDRLLRAFERVEARLSLRPFLVGDTFTRADLTLAALSAPLLRPAGHPWPLPAAAGFVPEVQELAESLRASSAGRRIAAAYTQRSTGAVSGGDLRAVLEV